MKHLHYSRGRVPGASRGGGEGGQQRVVPLVREAGERLFDGHPLDGVDLVTGLGHAARRMPRFEDLVPK
jgi:hypothetical protein